MEIYETNKPADITYIFNQTNYFHVGMYHRNVIIAMEILSTATMYKEVFRSKAIIVCNIVPKLSNKSSVGIGPYYITIMIYLYCLYNLIIEFLSSGNKDPAVG